MNFAKTCRTLCKASALTSAAALVFASAAAAQTNAVAAAQPKDLFELLDLVEKGLEVENVENTRRERAFEAAKENQAQLLADALTTLAEKEALSLEYETSYNENERKLGQAEANLAEQLGQMGELFGVVRQVSNDLSGIVWDSLISSQIGGRKALLDRLGRSKELPSTSDLEKLWYELQREMTQQGQVVRYSATILTTEGQTDEREVVRAGPFNAVSGGKFLLWEPQQNQLRELTRQPPSKYLDTVDGFENLKTGVAVLALDPSRGSLLNALTDTPSPQERVKQGGAVGTVIIVLGLSAFLLGIVRWVAIMSTSRKVSKQKKSDHVDKTNPLGRVLAVFEDNRDVDADTLELRLDEAVLRESSAITRYLWLVKTVSAIAPLLGLLGTVTGMIQTFQAITLFGAGDPKMMAGGISEALVTTMLGLITAIPLVLLYDTLANSTRYIIDVLDEQSAGLIATRAERDSVGD
ncbi:MAG: MotA/TolQ/ExbB proton channel family protein [Proteobacteria bacterium]|jgi:biopolymer transport protein ExbB|nr:MotA/TolQ/ExbB proton channel family protein [Pseudomonadota bacterium]